MFLLDNFGIDIFGFISFWPILFIGIGIYLIIRTKKRSDGCGSGMSDFKVFGDTHRDNFNGPVDGTDVSHFIGEAKLNLADAELKPGINKMNLSSFIGDIRVLVKRDAAVQIKGSSFIGDMRFFDRKQGGFGSSFSEQTPNYDTAEKKIEITANSFIGDIKITGV